MKKILSVLVLAALVVSAFSISVSANNSPADKITIVDTDWDNASILDGEDNAVENIDFNRALIELTHHDAYADYVPVTDHFERVFGEKYRDFRSYGSFDIALTNYAKKVLGVGGVLKDVVITISVPGITEKNNPEVFYYDAVEDTYTIIESTINGSEITFKKLPLTVVADAARSAGLNFATLSSETVTTGEVDVSATGVGYYGIIYMPASTSPETSVPTFAFVAVLVLALVGAAYAGKKVFAR